jgi:hypothetical protein
MRRRTYALALAGALASSGSALANPSASGTLAVTATVNASIQMVFDSDPSGVTLGGAGTNAATLAFGNISAYGPLGTHVSRTVGASSFTVSTPFDVKVNKANSASANYTLSAALASSDSTNTWVVDSTTLTTSAQNVTTSGTYGSDQAHTLYLTVPFTSPDQTAISNTVDFTATAN